MTSSEIRSMSSLDERTREIPVHTGQTPPVVPAQTAPYIPVPQAYMPAPTQAYMPVVDDTKMLPVYNPDAIPVPAYKTTLIRPTFEDPSISKHTAKVFRALRPEDLE